MKNIVNNLLVMALLVVTMGVFASSANAATNISVANISTENTVAPMFDVKVTEIAKIVSTNLTRFSFEPVAMVNPQNIDHWKVRVYCDKGISVTVNGLLQNSCGKAVRVERSSGDKSFVTLSNPGGQLIGFSFKLKAYDKNGKWLHTEKESFRWK